ncbi:substrate-binding domain-containing protein [Anaerocolumna sp. MB42-C2]|uniref:substrate-binding domain-containing protein n=1 Tax=Anaerocolumna sp. MB42-C2 TaxID=3070997 RepID=UPI0027E0243C|nr:substrate-binding domain-containing protein [Anaerocolumna sp. MB42-C2]WMJ85246.1 Ig-like domain-containing protein [Anaerocolumna sp. MB42-C2]
MKNYAKKVSSLVLLVTMLFTSFSFVPTTVFAADSKTVVFSGSTSVNPLIQALAEAFMAKNPGIKIIEQNVTGSGSGIADAESSNSTVDFGMSSRALTSDESAVLNQIQICMDGLAVVVNKKNPLNEISPAHLYKIYTKDDSAANWNQISDSYSKSTKIAPFGREAGSGTRSCFEDFFKVDYGKALPGGYDLKLDGSLSSTGAVQTAIQNNTGAIGYMSLGDMDETKVKALKIEGVEPSKYTVADGTYAIKRPFLLVYNKNKTISPSAQSFLDFIASADGQKIIDKLGFIKNGLVRTKATDITLRSTSVTINPGFSYSLTATIQPADASDKKLTYISSNLAVATVSSTGMIKGVGAGTATITVKTTDGSNIIKKCIVTVASPVTSVKLSKAEASVAVGKTVTLKATVNPSAAADKSVIWSSSDKKVAAVSSKGVVTGKKAGNAVITVTTKEGKKTATCKITVTE